MLIFPLLLAYEVGVLFVGHVNGADVITRLLYAVLGDRTVYLLVHAVVALMFLLWIRKTQRWGTLRMEIVAPVVLEAAIYALTLGTVISLILSHLLGLGITLPTVVGALGAGVHEELVFRLVIFCGLISLFGVKPGAGGLKPVLALVASSVIFAGAHHLGPYGEPFTAHSFAFRVLAGAAFGAIFWYRSLAHAVYAHVLYDLVVALG